MNKYSTLYSHNIDPDIFYFSNSTKIQGKIKWDNFLKTTLYLMYSIYFSNEESLRKLNLKWVD